jgi:hypothetical protein
VIASIAERYRRFADDECGTYAPRYARLALAVAEDEALQDFIGTLPDTQPNLFFAAVQYLTGPARMPADGPQLRRFARQHRSKIARLARTRRTQTNEIGRCASILPALPRGPLALIEVGASAGLCLLLDRFRYEYDGISVGERDSPVTLRCTPLGRVAVPIVPDFPTIVWRRGLDLDPVDVQDADAEKWLLSLIWSDHPERRQRLEAALRIARADPPTVERGDLADDFASLLSQAPSDALAVVFHSAVFPYVSAERRDEFARLLAEQSAGRDIVWISNEGPGMLPRLDELAPHRQELRFRVGRTVLSGGRGRTELLALAHPHGHDLEWLG